MTESYVTNWTAVLIVGFVGALAVLLMFGASKVLAPKRHSDLKNTPYECGIPASPYQWSQIQIRYYVFAFIFKLN